MYSPLPKEFKAYQTAAVKYLEPVLEQHGNGILALDMRMGKSAVALMLVGKRVLILCPVISKYPWLREIERWRPDLAGTVQMIEDKSTVVDRSKRVHILPYSVLVEYGKAKTLPRPDTLIVDEFRYMKNAEAQRSMAGYALAAKVDRTLWLDGTPMPNRPVELWPVLKHIGVFKNKTFYTGHFCAGHYGPWGYDDSGASNLDELAEALAPYMFRRTKEDLRGEWAEVLPPVVMELDLPVDEREKEFNAADIIKNPNPIAFEAMSEVRLMNGLRKIPLAIEHIKAVLAVEHKVIVFGWHQEVLEEVERQLYDYDPVLVHGGHSARNRDAKARVFQEHDTCRVFIGNYIAAGSSLTLDAASYVIFVEADWVPGNNDQAIARASGHGQRDPVRVDMLTIHQSIDSHILHSNFRKRDHIDTVIKPTYVEEIDTMSKHTKTQTAIRDLAEAEAESLGITIKAFLMSLFPAIWADESKAAPAKKGKAAPVEEAEEPEEIDEEEQEEDSDEDEESEGDDDILLGKKPAPAKKKVAKKKAAKKAAKEETPEPKTDKVTLEKVRNTMLQAMQTDGIGPQPVKKVLVDHGAQKVSDLGEDDYASVVEALQALIEEADGE